ncbi:MAG: 2-oxoacid:acceptor oxidoreductase family protein [Chloroflexota bacterium]
MSREEVVLGGFGGQGIVLAGSIVGEAAAIFDQKYATFTQDYGPEARGGACRAQVVISEGDVSFPYVERPTVLAVMSQEAYTRCAPSLKEDGILLIDSSMVKADVEGKKNVFSIPATAMAQELGRTAVANIIMLGFLAAVTKIVSLEALKKAVLNSVPRGTEELNLKALMAGYEYGVKQLKEQHWSIHQSI